MLGYDWWETGLRATIAILAAKQLTLLWFGPSPGELPEHLRADIGARCSAYLQRLPRDERIIVANSPNILRRILSPARWCDLSELLECPFCLSHWFTLGCLLASFANTWLIYPLGWLAAVAVVQHLIGLQRKPFDYVTRD